MVGTTGCTTVSSGSLVNPDKSDFSPRVAIAWSPKFKWTKNTVVRSGYGINYNTGQYSRFATIMAFQQPFALTQTNTISTPASPTSCNFSNMTLTTRLQLLHADHAEQLRREPELPPGHGAGL